MNLSLLQSFLATRQQLQNNPPEYVFPCLINETLHPPTLLQIKWLDDPAEDLKEHCPEENSSDRDLAVASCAGPGPSRPSPSQDWQTDPRKWAPLNSELFQASCCLAYSGHTADVPVSLSWLLQHLCPPMPAPLYRIGSLISNTSRTGCLCASIKTVKLRLRPAALC